MLKDGELSILTKEINKNSQSSLHEGKKGFYWLDYIPDGDYRIAKSVYEFITEKTTKIVSDEFVINRINHMNKAKKDLDMICLSSGYGITVWFYDKSGEFKFELFDKRRKDVFTTTDHFGWKFVDNGDYFELVDVDPKLEPICSPARVEVLQDYFRNIEDKLKVKKGRSK